MSPTITNIDETDQLKKDYSNLFIDDPIVFESLFWKVFRNMVIYNNIMSFMNKALSPPYDSIISVCSMLKNNEFHMLRDKVIREQYITDFPTTHDGFIDIFKSIKNNDDQDRLFYKQLFKQHFHYSFGFNNVAIQKKLTKMQQHHQNQQQLQHHKKKLQQQMQTTTQQIQYQSAEQGREQYINDIIEAKCFPALQILIQEYQYQPTQLNLHYALKVGTLKFIKLLLEPQFKLSVDLLIGYDYSIKSLNYLDQENIFNIILPPLQKEDAANIYRFIGNRQIIGSTSLKTLITFGKLILKSFLNIGFVITTTDEDQNITTLPPISISEIESFSNNLSKQELKLPLSHYSNQIESKKQMIKKLFKLYFSTNTIEEEESIESKNCYILYFRSFKSPSDYDCVGSVELYTTSFRFANYNILNLKVEDRLLYIGEPDFIFTHCQNDRAKQLEFITSICSLIKQPSNKKRSASESISFFGLIVSYDDLEFIEYVATQLDSFLKTINDTNIMAHIKSKQVLDFLFKSYYHLLKNWSNVKYISNIEVLVHYQELYRVKTESLLIIPQEINTYQILKCMLQSGKSIYKCNLKIYDIIYKSIASTNEKFELCRLVYKNFNYLINGSLFNNEIYFIKFLLWLYLNFPNEPMLKTIVSFDLKSLFLIVTGRFHEIDANINLGQLKPIEIIFAFENIGLLEWFLKKVPSTNNLQIIFDISPITTILDIAKSKGSLKTFQYIIKNYDGLRNRLIVVRMIDSLMHSFKHGRIELAEYLIKNVFDNKIPISKIDFDKQANNYSKVYFKDFSFPSETRTF